MTNIYFDNAATTKSCEAAVSAVLSAQETFWGNPSSLHGMGIAAKNLINKARKTIASSLGVCEDEIIFTSGGTMANNIAIFGTAFALKRRGNKIVTTKTEHVSVLAPLKELEKSGFEVVYLTPNSRGEVEAQAFYDAIDEKTILVTASSVNNETGAKTDVFSIKKMIREKKIFAVFHTDAVQSYLKEQIPQADLITVSAHKVHGPKGIGGLCIKKGIRMKPFIFGGEQNASVYPGTENVENIAGFAAAVEQNIENADKIKTRIKKLNMHLRERLKEFQWITVNSSENACDAIINISIPPVKSETMLHFLSEKGIYVSSGSACSGGKKSHVLTAMGLPDTIIDSAIRISFCGENTKDEIDCLIETLKEAKKVLYVKR